MKFVFFASDKPREHMLAAAMGAGLKNLGHDYELRRSADYGEDIEGNDLLWPGPSPDTDVAVFFGVKGKSRRIMDDHLSMDRHTVMLDKGYSRSKGENGHTEYSRTIINGPHPIGYMMRKEYSDDRFSRLGISIANRRNQSKDGHILFCGSTSKYHDFNGIGDPTEYAQHTFNKIRKISQRHFVYRPKPSAKAAPSIPGASYSGGSTSMADALRGCHVVVTHGSSAAMDAVLAGVPALILGRSIASPVSESDLANIENPFYPGTDLLHKWANSMAYCQWTNNELRSGEAVQHWLSVMRKKK